MKVAKEQLDTPAQAPEIDNITFALGVTGQGEPLEPDFAFEAGITKIHALFEYDHLTPDHIWTQVWYHNGDEMLSTSQPWLEDASGIYDYVIEAAGEPLPTGQWALEFYVDDELLTAGSFLIESETAISETNEIPDLADIPKVYRLAYTKWDGGKHNFVCG